MAMNHDDLIVVTGGAGFIARYVVQELNQRNYHRIVLFDRYDRLTQKHFENLRGLSYSSLESSENLEAFLEAEGDQIKCVIHLAANSNTTGTDPNDYLENNYELSKFIADFCIEEKIRFIYASSASIYGDGSMGFSDDPKDFKKNRPLNLYAWSKYLFDQYIYDNNLEEKVLGLRFFNVFGQDLSKADMQCIITKAFNKICEKKKVEIFDVDSSRDFVFVKDVARFIVESIGKSSSGIMNFGTGVSTPFRQVCEMVFEAMDHPPQFEKISMPSHLRGKYQHHTQSKNGRLEEMIEKHHYNFKFTPLQDAIHDTIEELKAQTCV